MGVSVSRQECILAMVPFQSHRNVSPIEYSSFLSEEVRCGSWAHRPPEYLYQVVFQPQHNVGLGEVGVSPRT